MSADVRSLLCKLFVDRDGHDSETQRTSVYVGTDCKVERRVQCSWHGRKRSLNGFAAVCVAVNSSNANDKDDQMNSDEPSIWTGATYYSILGVIEARLIRSRILTRNVNKHVHRYQITLMIGAFTSEICLCEDEFQDLAAPSYIISCAPL